MSESGDIVAPDPPTHWWRQVDKKIVCDLCPRSCQLSEGQRGFCFVRQNVEGEMRLTTYGKSTGFCIDPIEKKPLNHFLPGTPVLSFGTAGCNLGCKFCQNWDISKSKETEILSSYASPEEIVSAAVELECRSIAFTYNDPIIWAEYAIDTAKVAREAGIKTVAVTSGYINKEARSDFYKYIDAANVDLKAFSEQFYSKVTLSELQPVLDTLKWLSQESDTWFEITNLLIPDENDSEDEIKRMSEWILANLGSKVPIHFTAFHPDYKMLNKIRTPTETLLRSKRIATDEGLEFVYIGNVHHETAQNTFCFKCGDLLIGRSWHEIGEYQIKDSACPGCKTKIPGVFENIPGDWGGKRKPINILNYQAKHKAKKEDSGDMAKKPSTTKSKKKQTEKQGASGKEEESKSQTSNTKVVSNEDPADNESQREIKSKEPKSMPETKLDYVPKTEFSSEDEAEILQYVVSVVEAVVTGEEMPKFLSDGLDNELAYGGFLSLKRGGMLRACRGGWGRSEPYSISELLSDISRDAALSDPRFPAITKSELGLLTYEISLMYDPVEVQEKGKDRVQGLEIGEHGLVIMGMDTRGLLLPGVARDNNWDAQTFLEKTCEKAGLPKEAWEDDGVTVVRFRTIVFEQGARGNELYLERVSPQMMGELFSAIDLIQSNSSEEFALPQEFLIPLDAEVGMQLETESGKSAIRIGSDRSLFDIMKELVESLGPINQEMPDRIESLSLIANPITISPSDYPNRLSNIASQVLMVRAEGGSAISFPAQERGLDPIAFTFSAAQVSSEDWAEDRASITSFRVKGVRRKFSESKYPKRAAGFAGSFYPVDPFQSAQYMDQLFQAFNEEKILYPALMLPHAGWQFCAPIIAKTLSGVIVPPEIVIIGPKHTAFGGDCSVAMEDSWEILGSKIKIASGMRDFLLERVPGLVSDAAAHEKEHAVEVLLPFLHKLQPNLTVLPIAVGGVDGNLIQALSKALAELYVAHVNATKRPLLFVVSSDMNHYASQEENVRRDQLALQAMQTGDPAQLLSVCKNEQVSMCGAVPAAVIMITLNMLFKGFSSNVIAYQTSAAVTGDNSSVVGYAGVRFGVS